MPRSRCRWGCASAADELRAAAPLYQTVLGNRFAGALQGRATYSSVLDHCAGAEDSLPQRQVHLLVSYHAS